MKLKVSLMKILRLKTRSTSIMENEEAFMLLELLMVLVCLGLIFPLVFKFFRISSLSSFKLRSHNEINMEFNNALEYMEDEIRLADRIIEIKGEKNRNLGFVIRIDKGKDRKYILYEFNHRKKEIRRQADTRKLGQKFDINKLSGNNILLKNVESIDGSNYNDEDGILELDIRVKKGKDEIDKRRVIKLDKRVRKYEEF